MDSPDCLYQTQTLCHLLANIEPLENLCWQNNHALLTDKATNYFLIGHPNKPLLTSTAKSFYQCDGCFLHQAQRSTLHNLEVNDFVPHYTLFTTFGITAEECTRLRAQLEMYTTFWNANARTVVTTNLQAQFPIERKHPKSWLGIFFIPFPKMSLNLLI